MTIIALITENSIREKHGEITKGQAGILLPGINKEKPNHVVLVGFLKDLYSVNCHAT